LNLKCIIVLCFTISIVACNSGTPGSISEYQATNTTPSDPQTPEPPEPPTTPETPTNPTPPTTPETPTNNPNSLGYYGSLIQNTSWVAIVELTTPISFVDHLDFNTQVDSYCTNLGYVGAAKTQSGDFSVNANFYFQTQQGVVEGDGPTNKTTVISEDYIFANVYTNRRNTDSKTGNVGRASIGKNASSIIQNISSPTIGSNQMVLCQTELPTTTLPTAPALTNVVRRPNLPLALGFYGSSSSGTSWTAIVSLPSPITFTDRIDFNDQVDSYCSGLGYVGVAKTKNSDFSSNSDNYINSNDGVIAGNGPSNITTSITGNSVLENIYTNRRNSNTTNGNVGRATIGKNSATLVQGVASPTTGADQKVLCQTDILYEELPHLPMDLGAPNKNAVGFYGADNLGTSWTAIVPLSTPISFTDRVDFNNQVDTYCKDLYYVGIAKTFNGDFSTSPDFYLNNNDGIIGGNGPSNKVTLIPGDGTYNNIYTNRRNSNTSNGNVGRATIGQNSSTIVQNVTSPTTGIDQMVLCQTGFSIDEVPSLQ